MNEEKFVFYNSVVSLQCVHTVMHCNVNSKGLQKNILVTFVRLQHSNFGSKVDGKLTTGMRDCNILVEVAVRGQN